MDVTTGSNSERSNQLVKERHTLPKKVVVILNTLLLIALLTVLALFTRHIIRQNTWHYWKSVDGIPYRTNVASGQVQHQAGDGWYDNLPSDHPVPAGKERATTNHPKP